MSPSSGDSGQDHTNHVSQEMNDTKRIKLRHRFLFHVSWGGSRCDELKERLPGRLGGEPRNCEKVHVGKLPDHMHSTHSARYELSRRRGFLEMSRCNALCKLKLPSQTVKLIGF